MSAKKVFFVALFTMVLAGVHTGREAVAAEEARMIAIKRKLPPAYPSVGPLAGKPKTRKRSAPRPQTRNKPLVRAVAVQKVDRVYVAMVHGLVAAINQANFTGNYSVLRDLATARLRSELSLEAFANAFATLRAQRLDLSAAFLVEPEFSRPPTPEAGSLILRGQIPMRPRRLKFDVHYQAVDGFWRVDVISVSMTDILRVAGN